MKGDKEYKEWVDGVEGTGKEWGTERGEGKTTGVNPLLQNHVYATATCSCQSAASSEAVK